jgi:hypothetical protein
MTAKVPNAYPHGCDLSHFREAEASLIQNHFLLIIWFTQLLLYLEVLFSA